MRKIRKREKRILSPAKQKILLLLGAGLTLGLSRSPRQHYLIYKQLPKEWKKIDRHYLYRVLQEFREDRLIDYREQDDGTVQAVISEKGKRRILKFDFDLLKIKKPMVWDKIWRVVFYDIPEKEKAAREALREKLKGLGFYEWQKSVWVFPYSCRDEIDFICEFFDIRRYVRYAELKDPTNETELILHFGLE